jgi:hypothetical protein
MDATAKRFHNALTGTIRVWKLGPGGIVLDIDSNSEHSTPAMVWDSLRRRRSCPYAAACRMRWIGDEISLGQKQIEWLDSFRALVNHAYQNHKRSTTWQKRNWAR